MAVVVVLIMVAIVLLLTQSMLIVTSVSLAVDRCPCACSGYVGADGDGNQELLINLVSTIRTDMPPQAAVPAAAHASPATTLT